MTMEQSLSYAECLKDSPMFRCNLISTFKKITEFHEVVTEISETFSQMIKSGIQFSCHYQTFCSKLGALQGMYMPDSKFHCEVNEAVEVLSKFKEHFSSLMEGLHLIQREFKIFNDTYRTVDTCRKQWQKTSENHDAVVQKCATSSRLKLSESQEADRACAVTRNEYRQCSFKYVTLMERWDVGRQTRLLRVCVAIASSERDYFKQCSGTIGKVSAWEQGLLDEISQLDVSERRMSIADCNTSRVAHDNLAPLIVQPKLVIEGYLHKSGRKSWLKWQRRWFKVENNKLSWCKRNDCVFTVLEEDLRICTAKELSEFDRRFCFELIAPERTLVLQAEDDERMRRWVQVFQNGMSNQMGTLHTPTLTTDILSQNRQGSKTLISDMRSHTKNEDRKSKLIEELLQVRGNGLCCDCGDVKPRWSSSSLGITLCTECSGAHRSLGVHVSKVRSITLDNWEPEMLSVMFLLGNEVVNFIYESDEAAVESAAAEGIVKPNCNTDMNRRKLWAKKKWEEKRFVLKDTKKMLQDLEGYIRQKMPLFAECLEEDADLASINCLLRYGLRIHCIPIMMLSLTLGADPNRDDEAPCLPLHTAAASDFWPGCEFLILNGAKIDITDQRNQTALHLACRHKNVLVVWLLLKRGARQNVRNDDNCDALDVALETANADTVTLLRLHALNENTKEANLGSAGDETVNDVFRDFTSRAFNQLEEWFISNADSFHRMNSSRFLSANNGAL